MALWPKLRCSCPSYLYSFKASPSLNTGSFAKVTKPMAIGNHKVPCQPLSWLAGQLTLVMLKEMMGHCSSLVWTPFLGPEGGATDALLPFLSPWRSSFLVYLDPSSIFYLETKAYLFSSGKKRHWGPGCFQNMGATGTSSAASISGWSWQISISINSFVQQMYLLPYFKALSPKLFLFIK